MTTKTSPGNFFEDFQRGAKLVHAVPRTITEGDAALYVGLTGDRYPLHCSAEFARSLGYRRETINDLLVFHMVFGKTVNDVSLNAVANLGYASVRFLEPVYPGDTVRSVSEVIGKKENKSGENGVVWVKSSGTNQRGAKVLEYYRVGQQAGRRRRPAPTTTGDAKSPASELIVPAPLIWRNTSRSREGAYFETTKSEKIDHVDGMSIEDSSTPSQRALPEHSECTSTARREEHTLRKRLMYGGTSSAWPAPAFNSPRTFHHPGLERCAHAGPPSRETLYAWSGCSTKPTARAEGRYATAPARRGEEHRSEGRCFLSKSRKTASPSITRTSCWIWIADADPEAPLKNLRPSGRNVKSSVALPIV
jgi:2-methylfumaryl-CoA hydratase